MTGWKIVHAIHGEGRPAVTRRHGDGPGPVLASEWTNRIADEVAATLGQRIIRHDDGTCTIEDLPKPKTALELIEEWRSAVKFTADGSQRLDAIAEAIREGRAS